MGCEVVLDSTHHRRPLRQSQRWPSRQPQHQPVHEPPYASWIAAGAGAIAFFFRAQLAMPVFAHMYASTPHAASEGERAIAAMFGILVLIRLFHPLKCRGGDRNGGNGDGCEDEEEDDEDDEDDRPYFPHFLEDLATGFVAASSLLH